MTYRFKVRYPDGRQNAHVIDCAPESVEGFAATWFEAMTANECLKTADCTLEVWSLVDWSQWRFIAGRPGKGWEGGGE